MPGLNYRIAHIVAEPIDFLMELFTRFEKKLFSSWPWCI